MQEKGLLAAFFILSLQNANVVWTNKLQEAPKGEKYPLFLALSLFHVT